MLRDLMIMEDSQDYKWLAWASRKLFVLLGGIHLLDLLMWTCNLKVKIHLAYHLKINLLGCLFLA